ncbi:carotenoid oxygenase family protein [Paenibacillus hexagrammi]|uniref:Carotenoid oxygenase family protein n=1 Tax=Paenibacillus hexagrammi TaxID=2908839 RepID=A0ABY3SQ16_9BACL|nr:carotenoid oxygenase family protein [Paenibacillus sp. YPD9-1]UJF35779.1 carotenoid oxygenase family protein [Paenibacillus sp. YPD9-1]
MMINEQLFKVGFTNLDKETDNVPLQVSGSIPGWLSGTLFRNGPAKFTTDSGWHTHWFDGLAMIHKFVIAGGQVRYSNRFLRTKAYELAMTTGELGSGFGSSAGKQVQGGNNTNVSIGKIDDRFVALTESPGVIEFDPHTLETNGVFEFGDGFGGHFTTAHPHYDLTTGRYINFTVQFGKASTYHLYSIAPHSRKRELMCTVETAEPSYIHSFGNTEHYVILAEFPFVVNPQEMMTSGKSFIENFRWKPEQGTKFFVVRKSDGALVKTFEGEAFFSFHHVNAFEYDGGLVLDVCASRNANIVGSLQVSKLTDSSAGDRNPVQFRRYTLPFTSTTARYEILTPESVDLPTVNYAKFSGTAYRYAYGISTSNEHPEKYANQLVKVDTVSGESKIWREPGCYPGEPIFSEKPLASKEDEGVILSVVLDGAKGSSFLLILDAQTFTEIGRAAVPHHVPFGFHGMFTDELFEQKQELAAN